MIGDHLPTIHHHNLEAHLFILKPECIKCMFNSNAELKQKMEVSSEELVLTEVKMACRYRYSQKVSLFPALQYGALRNLNISMAFSGVQIPFLSWK